MEARMSSRYSRVISWLFAGTLIVLLSGATWSPKSLQASGAPLKVGLLIELTGAAGVYGPPSKAAAELAVAEINKSGGVIGRKVQLIVADDATDVKTAAQQARKLVDQDHVDVLISTESSAARDAVVPVTKRNNTFMIYSPLYEGGACQKNLFDLGEVPQQQVTPVVPYFQKTYQGRKWYIVGNDYNWPRALGKSTNQAVSQAKGRVVGNDYVPLGTSDFGSILAKIKSSKANFVMMTLVGSDAIAFVKQLHDFGLGSKVKVLGLALLDNTLPALKGSTSGTFAAFGYFSTLGTSANRTYIKALRAKFGPNTPQQTTLSESDYDSIHLWAKAVKKAGSASTDAVVKAMAGRTFDSPRGRMTVNGHTHHVAQHAYLGEARPNGTYRITHDFGVIQPGPQCAF